MHGASEDSWKLNTDPSRLEESTKYQNRIIMASEASAETPTKDYSTMSGPDLTKEITELAQNLSVIEQREKALEATKSPSETAEAPTLLRNLRAERRTIEKTSKT